MCQAQINLIGDLMKKIFALLLMAVLFTGCGADMQPRMGTGSSFSDKTLNGNTVDFFTLFRVQNNYGSQVTYTESNNRRER